MQAHFNTTLPLVHMTEYYPKPKLYINELFQNHIDKVKFYWSADSFTQALLVMLATNIMSAVWYIIFISCNCNIQWLTRYDLLKIRRISPHKPMKSQNTQ